MNNKILKVLTSIGLNPKESKVYLTILELGEGTVQEIAKRAGLKRTTVYTVLDGLKKQKAVIETKSKKRTYFIAEEPAELLERAKSKIEQFAENLELLNSSRNMNAAKPRTLFFNGSDGFKRIWREIFKSGISEYLILTDPREMLSFVEKGYITNKIISQKIKLGIKSRQLTAFSEYAKEIIAKDKQENRISKILPHIYKIPYTAIIFNNKVAFVSPAHEDMIIIIESENFAKTQRSIFEMLWEFLPEKNK